MSGEIEIGVSPKKASTVHPSQPHRRWRIGGGGSGGAGDSDSDNELSSEPRTVAAHKSLWGSHVATKPDAFASHERPIEDVKEVIIQPPPQAAPTALGPDGTPNGTTDPAAAQAAGDEPQKPITQLQTVLLVPAGITISSTAGGKGLLATRTGPLAQPNKFTAAGAGGAYQYATQPTAVSTTTATAAARPKYRSPAEAEIPEIPSVPPANLMFDKRVARGMTSTVKPIDPNAHGTGMVVDERKAARERSQQRIAQHLAKREHLVNTGKIRPQLQSVAYLHENIIVPKTRVAVDTSLYLSETENTVPTTTTDTQTDAFESPPPSPKFIPRKTGVEKYTQVDNERVFVFEEEVSPLLEVLTSKILEQSLTEVREEEELRHIRRLKRECDERAAAEAERVRQMEEAERTIVTRKNQTLMKQSAETVRRERVVQTKLFATRFARAYISTLESDVLSSLQRSGFLFDDAINRAERFLPGLYGEAQQRVDTFAAARSATDELLALALGKVQEAKDVQAAERAAVAAAKQAAEDEQRRRTAPIQLFLTCAAVNPDGPVGPIDLTASATVEHVQDRVMDWMNQHLPKPVPARSQLKFLWAGEQLDTKQTLYDLGVHNLSTLQMRVEKDVAAEARAAAEKAMAEATAAAAKAEADSKALEDGDGDGDGDGGDGDD